MTEPTKTPIARNPLRGLIALPLLIIILLIAMGAALIIGLLELISKPFEALAYSSLGTANIVWKWTHEKTTEEAADEQI
jgi:hypothetical protein|tara:strand:+ start:212 stop:448 length:237 start_codon:yes stop_codon:yes gene_type:complete